MKLQNSSNHITTSFGLNLLNDKEIKMASFHLYIEHGKIKMEPSHFGN